MDRFVSKGTDSRHSKARETDTEGCVVAGEVRSAFWTLNFVVKTYPLGELKSSSLMHCY